MRWTLQAVTLLLWGSSFAQDNPPWPPQASPTNSGPLYPPVQDQSRFGTRLFGYDDCDETRYYPRDAASQINTAYDDIHSLTSAPGVSRNLIFEGPDSEAANEFFGETVTTTQLRNNIDKILKNADAVVPGLLFPYYIHVKCGKEGSLCLRECPKGSNHYVPTTVEAYSDQDDGKGYSQITFCPAFFAKHNLDDATKIALSSEETEVKYNLDTWENQARVFLHEVTHLDFFMEAPGSVPAIWDYRVVAKEGKKETSSVAYTAGWTKILSRYSSKTDPIGKFSSQNADNYAQYALSRYARKITGNHPFWPIIDKKVKVARRPVLARPVFAAGTYEFEDSDDGPVFNGTQLPITTPTSCLGDEIANGVNRNIDATTKGSLTDEPDLTTAYGVAKEGWLANAFTFDPLLSGLNLRVLPLGDSITYGFQSTDGNGYRNALYNQLSSKNKVDFIGTVRAGSMSDNQNEGHSGATIDQISNYATSAFKQRPNVVLLHAGTNDLDRDENSSSAPDRVGALIDKITKACPDAAVLVSKLIPSNSAATQARIIEFNIALTGVVASRNAAGNKVFLVDHFTQLGQSIDLFDTLHPNDKGYVKMANTWFNAISWVANVHDWIKEPVGGTSGPGAKEECAKNPVWYPQGEIANGAGLGKDLYDLTCRIASSSDQGHCTCGVVRDSGVFNPFYTTELVGDDCPGMGYQYVHSVAFADLDGDGRDEYLHIGTDGSVRAFYNQGNIGGLDGIHQATPSWWDAGEIASGVGGRIEEIRFADLNGDGRAEYIVVHPNGSASVWLNQGQKSGGKTPANVGWFAQGLVASGVNRPGSSIRFADLNGDGRAEYLAVNPDGGVEVWLNLGPKAGTDPRGANVEWLKQATTATGVGGDRFKTRFADINGDGRADYLNVNDEVGESGSADLWRNGGSPDDGTHAGERVWIKQGRITGGDGTAGYKVIFGDLNGDGRAEYLEVDSDTSAVKAYQNGCPS